MGSAGAAEERAGIATARIATASAIRSNIAAIHATMAAVVLAPPSRRGSIGVRPLVSNLMMNPFVLPYSTFAIGSHTLTQ